MGYHVGRDSKISWTEHTFNPWHGCTKVSEGCAHCYAETFSRRIGLKIWGQGAERRTFGEKHWAEPLVWNAAAAKAGVMHRVFCGSMCDILASVSMRAGNGPRTGSSNGGVASSPPGGWASSDSGP